MSEEPQHNASLPLVWCKGIRRIDGVKEWRGVHRLTARLDSGFVALELLQVDADYRGEEIMIHNDRISEHIWPENQALIKPYL